jgi:thymidylate synthase (FAD)
MFEAETEVVELQSRLGRVGSIQAWDPWKARKSLDATYWFVSKIARLSHGLGEAGDFLAHFTRVVTQMRHESVLEFVPVIVEDGASGHLPHHSLRHAQGKMTSDWMWGSDERSIADASAFMVEAPIFVARQWMRHRSFSYLEMSRRYTKGSKVEWEYYGDDYHVFHEIAEGTWQPNGIDKCLDGATHAFHQACEAEYLRRLDAGWSNEIARGCMPMEAMTKFWVAGFDRDWEAFLKLRDDEHAQPEIQVFARFIRKYLEGKKATNG